MVDIDDIYDAAFDRDLFPALLRKILGAMNAQSGFLAWIDMESQANFEVQFGNDPAFLQSYAETYAQHDIMRPTLQAAGEGVVMQAYEHLQAPELQDSIFYKEWLAPQGIVDNLAVNLIKREQMFATMAILRTGDAPPFDAEDTARFTAIVPHIKRAVYMQSRLIHQANLVGGYQRITSGARNGLVLLDDKLCVLDIDRATQGLTGLRVDQVLGAPPFEKALGAAVRDAGPVAVELPSEGGEGVTLLCVAQPLERDGFGDFAGGAGVAHAVHVLRVDQPASIAFASMAELYGLTPTEVRVMADAFAHADLTALGDRLGMARATARTHLHRIYDKTRTQGFAGLCLLAHRFALPV
ncbi:MAG: helix-turn-helix transcriptional regulator [Alphaproteobacteria bacterium]|nr:helix-turn-helix transcriptional regulator [Alphaproteobacteria bacterium]MBU1516697.1 helix-turn-helix transcriptional regulator [Alphaproteobacteria bacterium]MBU2094453.1 helix-turn-helix transcriptional regulator [Alphaproteobacteria bacterium]MBU2152680.1 helix-turn-helix transcriptional regulator [Alphaproteobacteria bacterium]MBU2306172.1 helix-turn-helix transcriptional regulator [Alphaproteobacteria bacterium]